MASPEGPIQKYLADLRREMRGNPLLARRVAEEVADHLAEAAAAGRNSGMSPEDAEENAVRRFGPASQLARQFDRFTLPLKLLLGYASLATVCVALWLFSVIAFVLPSRDPSHIPLWRGIALGFLAYCALSWAYIAAGPRNAWLRLLGPLASVAAVGFGIFLIVGAMQQASGGGHFEGYLILMGLIVSGHGLAAIAYMALTIALLRRIRAA